MQTIKKKDISKYKPIKRGQVDTKIDDVEELDELVNGMGAGISGDEKNVNNSEIKTAPQATTDDYAEKAIQPRNTRLYSTHGAHGDGVIKLDAGYDVAKKKMLKLLEFNNGPEYSSNKTITDFNNNSVIDINELPKNVGRKVTDLIDSINNNKLDKEKTDLILKYINSKLNA